VQLYTPISIVLCMTSC